MRKLALVVAGVVVVGGAGFAVVTVAGADSGGHYRVAMATKGDVFQTVAVSGTVDHVNRSDVSFGTDGTVSELSVAVGDTVSAGQTLGTLDTTSLQAAVDKANSDLDTAETNLDSASTAAESAASAAASSSSSSADHESSSAGLVQEVKDAQTAASTALKTASDAMAAQTTACADPTAAACTSAGSATLTAQQAVKAAQDTLQTKLDALSAALASAEQQSSEQSSSQTRPSADSSASAGSVADAQASVDEAKVKLLQAQQALAGATLTSPISGTVASIPVAVDAQVSSGEAAVVVIGEGAAEVSATVTVEQLSKIAAGQQATVTPVGTSAKVTGTVTRVSTLPDTSAQTVAYPITITVDKPPASMASGSSATASVVVATAKNVVTVPTSAINRNTVTVLDGEQTTLTRVTVGAVGPTRTEIKEGLSAGQQVVLANLDSPLPTSDQTTNQRGFTNGRFGGGAGGGPGGGGGGEFQRSGN